MTRTDLEMAEINGVKRRADRNSHGHIAHALRLKLLDDVAKFAASLGGALVLVASAVLLGQAEPSRLAEIAVAILGSVITLIAVWEAVWKPGERARRHKDWAEKFAKIEDDCRLLMAGSGHTNVHTLMKEIQNVASEADLVPERHWRDLRQKYVVRKEAQ